jgi:hypothetical protein
MYPFAWPVGVDFVLKAPFLSDADRVAILRATLAAFAYYLAGSCRANVDRCQRKGIAWM